MNIDLTKHIREEDALLQRGKHKTGTDRIDAELIENQMIMGKLGSFDLVCDEPTERAGTGKGPNPLKYFLSGFAFCFLTWCARAIASYDTQVESLKMTVLGRFERVNTHAFTEIQYDLRLEGPLDSLSAVQLVKLAERECFVHNTLRRAVPLTGRVYLNEKLILSETFNAKPA